MALTYTPTPTFKETCPDFSLPAVDGRDYSLKDFSAAKVLMVMFICNHCPYVKAIEDRLLKLGRYYQGKEVQIAAICSNDGENYPEDSFENIKKRWQQMQYPFPYLYDESQQTAKAFGAVCTPDFFVYDEQRVLSYRGRLDDQWKDPNKVSREELKEAIDLLLEGKKPTAQQPSMGCSIKWR